MNSVHPPLSQSVVTSPRRISPPRYVYANSANVDYNAVLQSLINGLDIESIDPELYGFLTPQIQIMKAQLIKSKNLCSAKALDNALAGIYSYNAKITKKEETRAKEEATRASMLEMERRKANQWRPDEIQANLD